MSNVVSKMLSALDFESCPHGGHAQGKRQCLGELCGNLDKMGVPSDPKWRALILYMRGLQDFDTLDNSQKAELQQMVLEVLHRRDFSDESFRILVQQKEQVLARPWVQKLEQALAEANEVVAEFEAAARRRVGEVRGLEHSTVSILQSGQSLERAVEEIRQAFSRTLKLLEEDNRRLLALSATDDLTSLPNRRAFDSFLDACMAQALDDGSPLALFFLDIDHFKRFNDTYGHVVGDQALRSVATVLRGFCSHLSRDRDVRSLAARFGGEEFSVVLPGVRLDAALDAAEDLRRRMDSYNFVVRDEHGKILESDVRITVSIGVAELHESCPEVDAEGLMRCADRALYEAKAAGRNRVRDYREH